MKDYIKPAQNRIEAYGHDNIFLMITEGVGYRDIAAVVPCSIGALYDFLALPQHSERYAIAREAKADTYFSDALTIADKGDGDTYIDEKGNRRTDNEVVQRSRLRVETRKWAARCLNPAKYGEKVQVDQTVTMSPLAQAFAEITAQGNAIPISTAHAGLMVPGVASASALQVVDVVQVQDVHDPCVVCGDSGLDGAGCPLCGVVDV